MPTYDAASSVARANPTNAADAATVTTVFEGTMLRGTLLNAYGWWTLGTYTGFAGIGLAIASFAVLLHLRLRDRPLAGRRPGDQPRRGLRPRVRRDGLGAGGRHRPDDQARQLNCPPLNERPAGRTGGPFLCPPFPVTGPLRARSGGPPGRLPRSMQRGSACHGESGVLVVQSKEARSTATGVR